MQGRLSFGNIIHNCKYGLNICRDNPITIVLIISYILTVIPVLTCMYLYMFPNFGRKDELLLLIIGYLFFGTIVGGLELLVSTIIPGSIYGIIWLYRLFITFASIRIDEHTDI